MQEQEKTIQLRKPVTLGKGDGSITYEKLDLREPTAGEIEKSQRADTSVGTMINLISLIAGVPRAAVERICQRDLAEASDFLGGFTDAGAESTPATDGVT